MTETRLASTAQPFPGPSDARVDRKRKPSLALDDPDFLAFLCQSGALGSFEEEPTLAELMVQRAQACPGAVSSDLVNDLPGVSPPAGAAGALPVLSSVDTAATATTAALLSWAEPSVSQQQPFAAAAGPSSAAAAGQQQQRHLAPQASGAQQQQQQHRHRAVITAMPLPGRAGAAQPAEDDDTASVATLPMPHRKRQRRSSDDDAEVTSSPNDLVEVGGAGRAPGRRDAAAPARDQAGAAAATPDGVVKAVLVAKVLTKSDAGSKRVILPRIAVEANLPQLGGPSSTYPLSATDPDGASWPLVIKAWANGSNPKPVYVLEQVGELLKVARLGVGDALALMASEDGRYFLEWNTERARTAAARPTYSAFTFKQAGGARTAAAPAPAPAAAPAAGAQQEQPELQQPQAQPQQQPQQQPQHPQQQQLQQQSQAVQQQQPQQPQPLSPQQPPQAPQLQPQHAVALMAAIPMMSPRVSGAFIPTSPCQLLVMGSDPAVAPYLALDGPDAALPRAQMMVRPRSDAAVELPPADLLVALAGGEVEAGDNGALHAGGFLVCPRTAGCTRPAGHQGWCLGHKGYKKRGGRGGGGAA